MTDHARQKSLIFEVRDLSYSYDGRLPALEHIHLNTRTAECTVILGSNGSGKSTLLKILDGLYFPKDGSISAFGMTLSEQAFRDDDFNANFRKQVGLVFQDSDVQLFMPSVWEEVAFAPLQLGINKEEVIERVESALSALNISKIKDRPPFQLSGGEKKRVALASILSLSPKVWLLDEPSAGLDPRSARWLTEFILSQKETGQSFVIATHDLQLTCTVADRVYVLGENHQILAEGDPKQILSDQTVLESANLI